MINVRNQFQENNLNIEFYGDSIDTNNISVPVLNDVNFKPVIDYLIKLIPIGVKLESTFEDFSQEENIEKLNLIQNTVSEIYAKFNTSIDNNEQSEATEEIIEEEIIEEEIDENDQGDDLPF